MRQTHVVHYTATIQSALARLLCTQPVVERDTCHHEEFDCSGTPDRECDSCSGMFCDEHLVDGELNDYGMRNSYCLPCAALKIRKMIEAEDAA